MLIFTHIVSYWNYSQEMVEKVKHEIITKNWADQSLHELPNDLRLRILENEEMLRLFT